MRALATEWVLMQLSAPLFHTRPSLSQFPHLDLTQSSMRNGNIGLPELVGGSEEWNLPGEMLKGKGGGKMVKICQNPISPRRKC